MSREWILCDGVVVRPTIVAVRVTSIVYPGPHVLRHCRLMIIANLHWVLRQQSL